MVQDILIELTVEFSGLDRLKFSTTRGFSLTILDHTKAYLPLLKS